jgi:hypothetical protein
MVETNKRYQTNEGAKRNTCNTGWHTKWSSIWSINKIFISITVLETNIQKDHCIKIYPLWIKCSIQPPLSLATFFNRLSGKPQIKEWTLFQ